MTRDERDRQIGAVAALGERARRALYEHVVSQSEPVSRDQAARAVGIGRPLAAFHLDRLVQERLLEASYRRLGGRSGPGAGRPSKLYSRADAEVSVSLPPREYELAARLMARAIAGSGAEPRRTLDREARAVGAGLGEEARARCGPRPSRGRLREAALGVLADRGFEPSADGRGDVRLRNCPFDALAADEPDLVCGMNLALVQGLVGALDEEMGGDAVLDPAPGLCCVALRGWSRPAASRRPANASTD
ncbi:MAG: transcriptional regulator [Chloroflexi bacterium]|nr:MAG: transcriptional regulator [Chloroflexota bacterium]